MVVCRYVPTPKSGSTLQVLNPSCDLVSIPEVLGRLFIPAFHTDTKQKHALISYFSGVSNAVAPADICNVSNFTPILPRL